MSVQQERGLIQNFLGNQDSFTLEQRVLNALVLASSILATLLVAEAIAFDYSNALILSIIAAVIFWTLYFFVERLQTEFGHYWPISLPLGLWFLLIGFLLAGKRV